MPCNSETENNVQYSVKYQNNGCVPSENSRTFRPYDDASLGQCFPWIMLPLYDVFPYYPSFKVRGGKAYIMIELG
jgi:hypothetical protein